MRRPSVREVLTGAALVTDECAGQPDLSEWDRLRAFFDALDYDESSGL